MHDIIPQEDAASDGQAEQGLIPTDDTAVESVAEGDTEYMPMFLNSQVSLRIYTLSSSSQFQGYHRELGAGDRIRSIWTGTHGSLHVHQVWGSLGIEALTPNTHSWTTNKRGVGELEALSPLH